MADRSTQRTRNSGLDTPLELRSRLIPRFSPDPDSFGKWTEGFARFMGTPQFLLYMTLFCVIWLSWNSLAPEELQFDPRSLNFTLLTLILSLQASYAAPLLLLAQNRQDDRDRVAIEQDRQTAARNLSDTEYLTRELAALRIALREVATRDFVRSELQSVLEDLLSAQDGEDSSPRSKSRDSKASPKTQSIPKVKASKQAKKTPGEQSSQTKQPQDDSAQETSTHQNSPEPPS